MGFSLRPLPPSPSLSSPTPPHPTTTLRSSLLRPSHPLGLLLLRPSRPLGLPFRQSTTQRRDFLPTDGEDTNHHEVERESRRRTSLSRSGHKYPTAALAAAAAAADAARRRAPIGEVLEQHAPAAMRGFCAAYKVEPQLEFRAVGSARRPRHVCVLHLPLPPELQRVFGYTKLIRTSERSMRKKDAEISAMQVGAP